VTAASSLGRTVRWARKRAGMTQAELARALEMPQPSIARIERGTVLPRTATLLSILEATNHDLRIEPSGPPPDQEAIRRRVALDPPARTREALGRASRDPLTSPTRILRRLRRFGVPFVLIGELAEAAHGAPINVGRVIEICHAGTEEAMARLATALEDLGTSGAHPPDVRTMVGLLRLRSLTAAGDDYEILVRNAVRMLVDSGLLVRVASVRDLLRIRQANASPEDRAAASVLRALA